MTKDQSHEQSNKDLKGDGRPTGLFSDIDSLVVNELKKAEILRIINKFEEVMHSNDTSSAHHEETNHFQLGFT